MMEVSHQKAIVPRSSPNIPILIENIRKAGHTGKNMTGTTGYQIIEPVSELTGRGNCHASRAVPNPKYMILTENWKLWMGSYAFHVNRVPAIIYM